MPRSLLLALLVFTFAAAPLALPGAVAAHPGESALDKDHDGINDPPTGRDNCAGNDGAYNPRQENEDRDARGDACDTDDDGDTIDDAVDNCPLVFNGNQSDIDGDAVGDLCDTDDDGDGRPDTGDNCRFVPNPGQADGDTDGLGDACDSSSPGGSEPDPQPQDPTPLRPPGSPEVAPDTVAPEIGVALRRRHRAAQLGAGLAVPISCSEQCTVSSTLTLSARDARRLGARERKLGSGGAELDGAGETFVFVELSRAMLRRVRRTVRPTLRVDVTDAAGNSRSMTRRITIRR